MGIGISVLFEEMANGIKAKSKRKSCAVVCADSNHVLEAVLEARQDGLIEPLLIGDGPAIRACIDNLGGNSGEIKIYPTPTPEEAAQKAIDLVDSGEAAMIMKGRLETSVLMHEVLINKDSLEISRGLSALTAMAIPSYHKLLFHTDAGLRPHPDLKQKVQIIENGVEALRRIGISRPKVAVLAASEEVTEKMPETVDANALKEMNKMGKIKDCIIDGPMSYDLAVRKESVDRKGFSSPVAGDADLLIWPNVTCGNIAGKILMYSTGGQGASCALGAKVPIVLSSRGSDADEKYLGIILGSAIEYAKD